MATVTDDKPRVRFPALSWEQPVSGLQWKNERCIEGPLAQSLVKFWQPGRVLDAGCAMNGIFETPPVATVTHLTQDVEYEDRYLMPRREYVSADLRDLSRYADWAFDRVACVSTLEHIGGDNARYGGTVEHSPATVVLAAAELWRVTKHLLFVTVPFRVTPVDEREQNWRAFTPDTLRMELLLYWPRADVRYYHLAADGWRGPTMEPELNPMPKKVNQIACILVTR